MKTHFGIHVNSRADITILYPVTRSETHSRAGDSRAQLQHRHGTGGLISAKLLPGKRHFMKILAILKLVAEISTNASELI